jgi:glucosylceramidase
MKIRKIRQQGRIFRSMLLLGMSCIMVGAAYGQNVTWMRTSNNGDKLKQQTLTLHAAGTAAPVTITVTPATTYQTMMGFGGSFTESAALAMNQLDATKREEAISAYFGPTGANYSICRAQMGASDFSAGLYSFDDTQGDTALKNFSIAHDQNTIIRYIKDALAKNPQLKIFGSPWSAPAWMKTNNNMDGGGYLKSDPAVQRAWALYFVKYVQQYTAAGVPIWGITIQNEPAAVQSWPSMIFNSSQERDFLKNYLGPILAANSLGPDKLAVMFLDHNRDMVIEWANTFYADPVATSMVWGVAIHWYDYGFAGAYANVKTVYDNYKSKGKHILATEQCLTGGTHMGDYSGAEEYAKDIFGDCSNGCEGWVDWNLALNQQGGPNVSNNWCSAGIIVNGNSITYNPLYYYMAQVSKYVRPGAVRIGATATGTNAPQVMAFKNTDGTIAVLAYTGGNAYNAKVVIDNLQFEYSATARSMDDFVWKPTSAVTQKAVVQMAKNSKTQSHLMGIGEKQNSGADKYQLTGKKISTGNQATDADRHVTPGYYVEKPAVKKAGDK